jgi:hypothetical protein
VPQAILDVACRHGEELALVGQFVGGLGHGGVIMGTMLVLQLLRGGAHGRPVARQRGRT